MERKKMYHDNPIKKIENRKKFWGKKTKKATKNDVE